ncbi:hypothetical protein TNCT_417331 [Trichonephila clavata]|uniref:Uncharacterized protein n=1 Tax=Trichonephila clavata TaxID=2740835 RepID=A0A8X6LK14_TRICU|nr:hypothetical protein TNCT_417331 [Trichonephila clavata]
MYGIWEKYFDIFSKLSKLLAKGNATREKDLAITIDVFAVVSKWNKTSLVPVADLDLEKKRLPRILLAKRNDSRIKDCSVTIYVVVSLYPLITQSAVDEDKFNLGFGCYFNHIVDKNLITYLANGLFSVWSMKPQRKGFPQMLKANDKLERGGSMYLNMDGVAAIQWMDNEAVIPC